jgi:hypothetical protein
MQRNLQTAQSQTDPVEPGEVRWIERLQRRPLPPSTAQDGVDDPSWIRRLQRGAAGNQRL